MTEYVPINDARNSSSYTPGYPRSVSNRTTRRTCLKRCCRYSHRISKVLTAAQSILSTRHSLSFVYWRWAERKPDLHFLLTWHEISPYDFDPRQPWSFLLYTSMTVAVLRYPRSSQRRLWFLHLQAHILTAQEVIAVNRWQSLKSSDLYYRPVHQGQTGYILTFHSPQG